MFDLLCGVQRGPASWTPLGINIISQSHNNLLTAACIYPAAPSSAAPDVFVLRRLCSNSKIIGGLLSTDATF